MLQSVDFQYSCPNYSNDFEFSLDYHEFTQLEENSEFVDVLEFFISDESFPLFDSEEREIILKQGNEEKSLSFEQYTEGNESIHNPLTIPTEDKEIENRIGLNHLAMAYGEAVEMKQTQLAEVIVRRITDKVSVYGEIKERVFYYAFSRFSDNLRQEAVKNFGRALQAFYQIFPYGMIPHFTANSAILEGMPHDADILHVVDFDIGDGVQWSSMIMAISQQFYNNYSLKITLKITAIKWEEEDCRWTKRRLRDYASSLGVMLVMEEIELQHLGREMKRMNKRGGKKEWLGINCMWGLPHMGRRRSGRQVMEFIAVAKELLGTFTGIVTYSDGSGGILNYKYDGFGSFFGSYMQHYESLLESMEWKFVGINLKTGFGLEGLSLRNESLIEAKEMVREGITPFGIRIEGENDNQMVLEWKGIPLVRVSAWR